MVNTIEHLIKDIGFNPIPNTVNISISKSLHQSKVLLFSGLNYFTNNMAVWQPEYNEVAKWLVDNKGYEIAEVERRSFAGKLSRFY